MIAPLDSLAFSIPKNKGVYALLLGSGVSRAARIPTGWEVILDLVRQLAKLQNADPGAEPDKWYQSTFGEAPSYSALLDRLGKTPAERQSVLKGYIEPTDDDRAAGLKQPTKAHRAIAELVVGGFVRVILTTNFDRLTEQALEAAGVPTQVIGSPDAVDGAEPLWKARCTVIKLHGDYLDTRIKNTIAELERYDGRLDRKLDEVLDQYGLIVSGWSAEWDTALRAAIERCPSRRYTTYWNSYRKPTGAADELVRLRSAEVIPDLDADTFFTTLAEKVRLLEELARPHPLSTAEAVATLKRYIPDPVHRIRLHDLIVGEADRLAGWVRQSHRYDNSIRTHKELRPRTEQLEVGSQRLAALFAAGAYHGDAGQDILWARALSRLIGDTADVNGDWGRLRLYPPLLCLYAGGVAAIAASRYSFVKAILVDFEVRDRDSSYRAALYLKPAMVLENDAGNAIFPSNAASRYPVSEQLHKMLQPTLMPYFVSATEYELCFDRFECLWALVGLDLQPDSRPLLGRYVRKFTRLSRSTEGVIRTIRNEVEDRKHAWPPLKAGLFSGDPNFASLAVDALTRSLSKRTDAF